MGVGITALHHVNITVLRSLEEATKHFYGSLLGLVEVPKPEESRSRGGAWYQIAQSQIHLSIEDEGESRSKRHFCLVVGNLAFAEEELRAAGVEIIPDERPVRGCARFYVRDPGGNLIEIADNNNN
jgi:catechol 2,3-dioxygenase-like lactoylglutathione lyase family enzyme